MEQAIRVLVVEDDREDYQTVVEDLSEAEDERFVLEWAPTYEKGLEAALRGEHDVILVDYRLGAHNGVELVQAVKKAGVKTPMIFLSGSRDRELDRQAVEAGAADYLSKGRVDPTALVRSIRFALQRRKAEEAEESIRQRELSIGAHIQETLLLGEPPTGIEGVQIAAVAVPSQAVDGDFWGFFVYGRDRFDVLVGDVMGKGTPAALLAAAAKSHFQDCQRRLVLVLKEFGRIPEPEEVVLAAHDRLTHQLVRLDTFITLCYCRFDLRSKQVLFVDAGHMNPIHYHAETGTVDLLPAESSPLGISRSELYAQLCIPFSNGDAFVFYSDGVTDARNAAGQTLGREGILEAVQEVGDADADTIARHVREKAQAFAGAEGLRDDLTCLVVRIAAEDPPRPLAENGVEVKSNPQELADLRALVRWFCTYYQEVGLTEHEVDTLMLAVSEAVTNILNHAYWGSRHRRVQVQLEAYPGEVRVDIADWGRPFDPELVPEPAFDGSRTGGFGVYIIRRAVDEHRFYRDDVGRNHLLLVRKARGRAALAQ